MSKKKARFVVLACVLLVALSAAFAWWMKCERDAERAEAARVAAEQVAALEEANRRAAEAEAARIAAEEEAARLAAEQAQSQAEAEAQAQALADAQAAAEKSKNNVSYGDQIGTVWVEGTEVNCNLYWGDTSGIFRAGAGCSADNGCVMPGDNGTVFVGGHTDSWFVDLKSTEIGAIIHLDTLWGEFEYQVTETKVIYDTEVDQCRWGDTEPNCILYTCYPFGIQTPTNRRYLVYAEPLQTDDNGVIPSSLPDLDTDA